MNDYNLDVLLEKTNKSALGIRSRQSGITLKEYFLNERQRAINIKKSQKIKLNEALEKASFIVNENPDKKCKKDGIIIITNKAGKDEKRLIGSSKSSVRKAYSNFRKVITELYSILKYRCSQIIDLCNRGIKLASSIIKGKSDIVSVNTAKNIKSETNEYSKLLKMSLSEMRETFSILIGIVK